VFDYLAYTLLALSFSNIGVNWLIVAVMLKHVVAN